MRVLTHSGRQKGSTGSRVRSVKVLKTEQKLCSGLFDEFDQKNFFLLLGLDIRKKL